MPIRTAIADLNKQTYPEIKDGHYNLLVIGGSQGAKIFGEVIPEAIRKLPQELQKKLTVTQQCRKADVEDVEPRYQDCACRVNISSFFKNMPELYTTSHLIISRAGASSVFEIAAAGLPSVLIPLPTAADDHQTANARYITGAKGGIAIPQKEFTPEKLASVLTDLFQNPQKLRQMSDNIRWAAITDASQRFADAVEKEIIAKR